MGKLFYLSNFLLFSNLLFGGDAIVRLNMGGYLPDIARQTLNESGSEYFKGLLSGKFSHTIDSEGRIFIGCSQAVAEVMHHYMCHHALCETYDIKIHIDAANFFLCNGLKEMVSEKNHKNAEWKYLSIEPNLESWNLELANKKISVCPLCKHVVQYYVNNSFRPVYEHILAHIIISHDAEIENYPSLSCIEGNSIVLKYKNINDREINENEYEVKIIPMNIPRLNSEKISFECRFCEYLIKFDYFNDDYKKIITQHLAEHEVETLHIDAYRILIRHLRKCR